MGQLVYAVIIFGLLTLLGLGVAYLTGWDGKTVLLVLYAIIVFIGCIQAAEDL